MPEPIQHATERLSLAGAIGFAPGKLCTREDSFLVQEGHERANIMDLMQPTRAPEEELGLGAIGQDEEHDALEPEVLQEERLTQLLDDGRSPGHDLLVRLIRRDEAEIEVRVFVRFASGVGAPEEGSDDPLVRRTQVHESLDQDVVIRRRSLDQAHSRSLACQPGLGLRVAELLPRRVVAVDELTRFFEFEQRLFERLSTRTVPFDHGVGYVDEDYPERYYSSFLLVERVAEGTARVLDEAAGCILGVQAVDTDK